MDSNKLLQKSNRFFQESSDSLQKSNRFFQISNNLVQKSKLVISVIIFFVVCLFGSVSHAGPKAVVPVVDTASRALLQLAAVENDTDGCEFQLFYGSDVATAFVFPRSTFHFNAQKALPLSTKDLVIIKCCKGSFLPVFVQHGGAASGDTQVGFDGPFYLSMWLAYPQVPETSKTHIRYMVKSGTTGTIGVKIGNRGDYRFVAYENVHFIV